jgi:hypothetical protein
MASIVNFDLWVAGSLAKVSKLGGVARIDVPINLGGAADALGNSQ